MSVAPNVNSDSELLQILRPASSRPSTGGLPPSVRPRCGSPPSANSRAKNVAVRPNWNLTAVSLVIDGGARLAWCPGGPEGARFQRRAACPGTQRERHHTDQSVGDGPRRCSAPRCGGGAGGAPAPPRCG